ncbi:hypothetical protein [Lysinibacillus sp. NPDC056232]
MPERRKVSIERRKEEPKWRIEIRATDGVAGTTERKTETKERRVKVTDRN